LNDINKQKKIILQDLKKIIKSYSFIQDIWVYGNFEDDLKTHPIRFKEQWK
tara:strand:- start:411 stop:563 length:153 start_codon:yes stop_codon:yes gene_type:complete